MRTTALLLALISAFTVSARAADVIFDSGGFEAYSPGAVAGQHAWRNDDFDPALPDTAAAIASAPDAHGSALAFENFRTTESSATVDFGNLVGAYNYAVISFDIYRQGGGANNALWWSAAGSSTTGYYGLAPGGAAQAVLPIGYFGGAPSAALPASQWTNVRLQYDLVYGRATAFVDGVAIAENVDVGTSPTFSGWTFTDQNLGSGLGQRAYVDNLRIVAANSAPIPEPGSLALLALGVPLAVLLPRRRRR